MQQLLIATRNRGKIPEIQHELQGLPVELLTIGDVPGLSEMDDVEEVGETFEGNALIKAFTWGMRASMLTLAEDSGLTIDALDDWPGVITARIASDDNARNLLILEKMREKMRTVAVGNRKATLHSVIAIFDPATQRVRIAHGKAHGRILEQPEGTGGFGVDPIFFYAEAGKSGGTLSLEEKNVVSHRGHSMKKARACLEELLI